MIEDEAIEELEEQRLSRRGLVVKGGLLTAGAAFLGGPAAASALGAATATKVKVGSRHPRGHRLVLVGVQEGRRPGRQRPQARGVSVTQVYANNDVSKQVAGHQRCDRAKVNVIATSVPTRAR